jgi:hypothetical protein
MKPTLVLPAAAALLFLGEALSQPQGWLGLGMLGRREELLAHFDSLPEANLKALFMSCSKESSRRVMGADEGALCAMAWDELLERFGGDVDALLAWWRGQRDS